MSEIDSFSLKDGWGHHPDVAEEADGDVGKYICAHGWNEYDEVGIESFAGLKVYQHAETDAYLLEYSNASTWRWVYCDSWPSMMELYGKWASIACAQALSWLVEDMKPVVVAAEDTDAWREKEREEREFIRRQKAERARAAADSVARLQSPRIK